jgi:hypothetical protein
MEDQDDLIMNEMAVHAQSKKEVYQILQIEGHVFLPPISQASSDYISDVLNGSKKVTMFLFILCST